MTTLAGPSPVGSLPKTLAGGKSQTLAAPSFTERESEALAFEIVTPSRFLELEAEWRELTFRAVHPNVFMEPTAVKAAAAFRHGESTHVVLVWDEADGDRRLVGVWALVEDRKRWLGRIRVLTSPIHPHTSIGTPVVDRQMALDVLDAMFHAIAVDARLPKIVEIVHLDVGLPFCNAFEAALQRRRLRYWLFGWRLRPELHLDSIEQEGPAKLTRNRKRSLARRLRGLQGLGSVTFTESSKPDEVSQAFEEFLMLEKSGWKGSRAFRGQALLLNEDNAAFARETLRSLSRLGLVSIVTLRLDGRPAGIQVVLRSGPVAYTWKTTYDEDLSRHAPGLILLQHLTNRLCSDSSLKRVDSCTQNDQGRMGEFWSGRKHVANALVDVGSGSGLQFLIVKVATSAESHAKTMVRRALRLLHTLAHSQPKRLPRTADARTQDDEDRDRS